MAAETDFPLYRYRARCLSVHDGDTATFLVALGLRVSAEITVRLADVDSAELRASNPESRVEARLARDYLASLIAGVDPLYVRTRRDGKSFDRYVAEVYLPSGGSLVSVADLMIAAGYARRVR